MKLRLNLTKMNNSKPVVGRQPQLSPIDTQASANTPTGMRDGDEEMAELRPIHSPTQDPIVTINKG